MSNSIFRVLNPRWGEIVETTSFRTAYWYARRESRASLHDDDEPWRTAAEIVIFRTEPYAPAGSGEVLARFPVKGDPDYGNMGVAS